MTAPVSEDENPFRIDFVALLLDQSQREHDLAMYYRYYAPSSPVGVARATILAYARELRTAWKDEREAPSVVMEGLDRLCAAVVAFEHALAQMERTP